MQLHDMCCRRGVLDANQEGMDVKEHDVLNNTAQWGCQVGTGIFLKAPARHHQSTYCQRQKKKENRRKTERGKLQLFDRSKEPVRGKREVEKG